MQEKIVVVTLDPAVLALALIAVETNDIANSGEVDSQMLLYFYAQVYLFKVLMDKDSITDSPLRRRLEKSIVAIRNELNHRGLEPFSHQVTWVSDTDPSLN